MPLIPCFNCNPKDLNIADPECPYCNGQGKMQTDSATRENSMAAVHAAAAAAGMFTHTRETHGLVPSLERYPVAIAGTGDSFIALANDGTLWRRYSATWNRIDDLPQPEAQ